MQDLQKSKEESDLIREYYDNREFDKKGRVIRDEKMYTEPYYALNKILQDRGLSKKVERLQRIIKDAIHDQTKYINTELMQIHCVAVCFKRNDEKIKILVAKRQETREKHKGQWEFGCAKAEINKSIAQKLREEYKQDFNIDINPVLDITRTMQEPIPIALYHVEHTAHPDKKDQGIITLAEIVQDYDPVNFRATDKHSEIRWVTEADLDNIETTFGKTVPDFKQTLIEAFRRIKLLG